MAGSFGDSNDNADKRPGRTIEGTAEEVSVEGADRSAEESSGSSVSEPEQAAQSDTAETPSEETAEQESAEDEAADKPAEEEPVSEQPAAAAPPSTKSGGGFFGYLFAALLGGLIGAGAFAFALPFLPAGVAPFKTDLETRIAALEAKPAPKPAVSETEVAALKDRVTRLEDTMKSLAAQAEKGGSVADAAATSQQIAEAEKRLEAEIDKKLAAAQTGAGSQALDTLTGEVDGLKSQVAEIAALKSQIAELGRTQSTETGLSASDQQALSDMRARIAKLEGEIPDLSSSVAQTRTEAQSAARAAALADLRATILSGAPYATELSAFTALGKSEETGALVASARQGLPTLTQLQARFDAAETKALAAEVTPADDTLLGTLMSSASSMVKIRRLDSKGEGDSADAVLVRARNALDAGNVSGAVSEVETLTGPPAKAMADWLSLAKSRLAAETALKRLAGQDVSSEPAAQPSTAESPAQPGL
ncbi:mitofilin family membrane protein [Methyloligella sp. 2.7D]|uniref:mitofilin family membrane protein n=1 Tax=unclassified Methyloligella TaxID=2625955 RepID=UPI00157D0EB2|nr:mitofilin family membrane protein [Methyloligella sp. GL2]QKP76181.1 hypothetical protein HT051_01155 [Methyloligella sp. GL2]